MIRFSRDEDYSIILINELAKHYNKRLVPLSEIAKHYSISLYYLRNLANKLIHAGIIKAVEGKKGGYFLQKDPKEITIGEVLQVFSREPLIACCSNWNDRKKCQRNDNYCDTITEWRKINERFIEKLSSLSLEEFLRHHAH